MITHFSGPRRSRPTASGRVQKTALAAVLLLGLACWGTILTKNGLSALTVAAHRPQLVLQWIQLGKSRRTAMICDHLVREGQTVTLNGASCHVDRIVLSHVDLTVDGKPLRLPIMPGEQSALEMKLDFEAD